MSLIYGKEDAGKAALGLESGFEDETGRSGLKTYFTRNLSLILIFAAWAKPQTQEGFWYSVYQMHWPITFVLLVITGLYADSLVYRGRGKEWVNSSWDFAKLILPLLFAECWLPGS
jgi:hypothetical protein